MNLFTTHTGVPVPAVSGDQMRRIDELAETQFHLSVLQMMENAGRNLASQVQKVINRSDVEVTILAGSGGNGGGGLAAARHLYNHGFAINLILSRLAEDLAGPAGEQWAVLRTAGLKPCPVQREEDAIHRADVVIDALIGYSLSGAPRGRVLELIELCNRRARRVISLDMPSGLDATSGEAPGAVIAADQVLSLALPKIGLAGASAELFLGDIGIPAVLYQQLGISVPKLFDGEYVVPLNQASS